MDVNTRLNEKVLNDISATLGNGKNESCNPMPVLCVYHNLLAVAKMLHNLKVKKQNYNSTSQKNPRL